MYKIDNFTKLLISAYSAYFGNKKICFHIN